MYFSCNQSLKSSHKLINIKSTSILLKLTKKKKKLSNKLFYAFES